MARLRSFLDADNQLKFGMACALEGCDLNAAREHVFDLDFSRNFLDVVPCQLRLEWCANPKLFELLSRKLIEPGMRF